MLIKIKMKNKNRKVIEINPILKFKEIKQFFLINKNNKIKIFKKM